MTRAVLAIVAPALVAVIAAGAHAQPRGAAAESERQLVEGRRLYGELDFVGAVDALRRALSVPGITDAQRLEANEYLGSAYVVLERNADARAAFLAMLAIDPYHVVREPSGSPKIARFVERLRREVAPDAALDPSVVVSARLPRAGRVGRDVAIPFVVRGPPRVASIRVFLRGVGETAWARIDATRSPEGFVALVPSRRAPDELELYADARDEDDRVVARAGEPFAPLALSIVPGGDDDDGGDGAFYTRWWFWAGVGAVVVGGVAIGFAASSGERAPPGSLPPGRVELP